jgi:aquaporin Z
MGFAKVNGFLSDTLFTYRQ